MKTYLRDLKTLVMMQLKDKLDLSFVRSVRSTVIKATLSVLKLAVAVVAFYLVFFVSKLLSVFRPFGYVPDTVVNLIFSLIQLMSVVTCTVGLAKTLYMTADNKVLLTLPVSGTCVYMSKLILYYIFELKKNISLTLPLFVAYGLSNDAVWYYYPWLSARSCPYRLCLRAGLWDVSSGCKPFSLWRERPPSPSRWFTLSD